MCGIFSFVGRRPARDVVIDASRRMEYRGYDSAGVALLDGCGGMSVRRRAGRLANLEAALDDTDDGALVGNTGLGHTLWATHGRPTDGNAHPHRDAAGKIAVVPNGIIENFTALRHELEAAGPEFASDSNTSAATPRATSPPRFWRCCGDWRATSRWSSPTPTNQERSFAAHRSTPLVIGVGDGEMFVGSDVAAFIEHTRDAVELGQDKAVVLTADGRRPTPTRRGRRPYGSASSQTGSQKPCVWPRFAMHRIAAA
jgi:glutamine---fructose-6-phosphate transaminase (isomerizing)